jgi:hypothetical protein
VDALRRALAQAGMRASRRAGAVGRAGRGKLARAGGGLRAVQQEVLRTFATTGRPPAAPSLAETAARYATTPEAVLARLHAEDFLRLGPGGQIRAIYLIPSIVLGDLVRCQPDDFSAGYFAGSGWAWRGGLRLGSLAGLLAYGGGVHCPDDAGRFIDRARWARCPG